MKAHMCAEWRFRNKTQSHYKNEITVKKVTEEEMKHQYNQQNIFCFIVLQQASTIKKKEEERQKERRTERQKGKRKARKTNATQSKTGNRK